MTLGDLSEKFVAMSGRLDLQDDVTLPPSWWINQGQRFLDRLVDGRRALARWFKTLSPGDIAVAVPGLRVITEVWVADLESRTRLEKASLRDLRLRYPAPFHTLATGRPLYYAPASLRAVPDNSTISQLDYYSGYGDVLLGNQPEFNGVLVLPPVDKGYQLELMGKFYSPELTSESDTSYWASEHPMLLLWAALYQLEVSYRNTEGAKDWLAAIESELALIDRDMADEAQIDVAEMDG